MTVPFVTEIRTEDDVIGLAAGTEAYCTFVRRWPSSGMRSGSMQQQVRR